MFCNDSAYQDSDKELPVAVRITCLIFRDKSTKLAVTCTWRNHHIHKGFQAALAASTNETKGQNSNIFYGT